MGKFNCIIVEDEPIGAEILEGYISQVPFLNHLKTCTNAMEALQVLKNEKIDLMFLDIHLPKIKGFDFLNILSVRPKVIITSAYHEYALKGYEYNVIDYLLKPIEFTRFLSAVNKLNSSSAIHQETTKETNSETKFLFFNSNKKKVKIYLNEILYIESQKEYIKIFLLEKTITTRLSISKLEEQLPLNDFLRIHRSYIVARNKIRAYTASDIELNDKTLPIGRHYKHAVLMLLEQDKLSFEKINSKTIL